MEPNGLAVFETRERVIGHPRSVFSERSARPCLLPPRCYALGSAAVAGDADHQLMRLTTQVSKDARPGPPVGVSGTSEPCEAMSGRKTRRVEMEQLPDVCLRRRGLGKRELSGMAAPDNVLRLPGPLIETRE